MSLAIITLPTNKSISTVSDHVRKLGQGEKGQTLEVIVTDANNSAYDLTGKSITFSENKEGGKIVSDNESSHFSVTDAKAGRFTYTLASAVYAASGTAWFDITNATGSVIDTTKSFDIDVIEDESIHINNDNYVSNLQAFQTHYQGVIQKSKQDSEALLAKINSDLSQALADNNKKAADALTDQQTKLQTIINALNKIETDFNNEINNGKQSITDIQNAWKKQTADIQAAADSQASEIKSDADAQKQAIQAAADKQLQDNKSANDAEINQVKADAKAAIDKVNTDEQAAIKAVNDARDKAIQQATIDFSNKLNSIQSDYNSWKASTASDFQKQLDKLSGELSDDEAAQAKLKAAIDAAQSAISKIKDIDFTQFAHKSDLQNYYTKTEVDTKLADAGKLKTVSVNGGTKVGPDATGNANISVPSPDLSSLETKADAKSAHDSLTSQISTKANSADVYDKATVDSKIAEGGKLKTVSINGGTKVSPDTTGNANLTVPQPDLSGYETKAAAQEALSAKADVSTVTTLQQKLDNASKSLGPIKHFTSAQEQQALTWSKTSGGVGVIDN